jgi:hypothetical protein
MAIVVNKAFPSATTSPDESVKIAQSIADPHLNTLRTNGATTTIGSHPATDSQGNPNTGVDWTKAGVDLDR